MYNGGQRAGIRHFARYTGCQYWNHMPLPPLGSITPCVGIMAFLRPINTLFYFFGLN